jgi:hypothetical protein
VSAILTKLGIANYANTFASNEIDMSALLLLSDSDLKELGVTALGPRRKLLAIIADPRYTPYKPSSTSISPSSSSSNNNNNNNNNSDAPPVPPALDSASERRHLAFKQYAHWTPPNAADNNNNIDYDDDDDEHIYDIAPPPRPVNDEDPPYRPLPAQTSFDRRGNQQPLPHRLCINSYYHLIVCVEGPNDESSDEDSDAEDVYGKYKKFLDFEKKPFP